MAWLRIDDGFVMHPKLVALTDRQFRLWLKLLCWCARYQTKGVVTGGAQRELGIKDSDLCDFDDLGLVDARAGGEVVIHDFDIYNGKRSADAERQQRNRDTKRDAKRDQNRDGPRDTERDETRRDRNAERDANVTSTRDGRTPTPRSSKPSAVSATSLAARVENGDHDPDSTGSSTFQTPADLLGAMP